MAEGYLSLSRYKLQLLNPQLLPNNPLPWGQFSFGKGEDVKQKEKHEIVGSDLCCIVKHHGIILGNEWMNTVLGRSLGQLSGKPWNPSDTVSITLQRSIGSTLPPPRYPQFPPKGQRAEEARGPAGVLRRHLHEGEPRAGEAVRLAGEAEDARGAAWRPGGRARGSAGRRWAGPGPDRAEAPGGTAANSACAVCVSWKTMSQRWRGDSLNGPTQQRRQKCHTHPS